MALRICLSLKLAYLTGDIKTGTERGRLLWPVFVVLREVKDHTNFHDTCALWRDPIWLFDIPGLLIAMTRLLRFHTGWSQPGRRRHPEPVTLSTALEQNEEQNEEQTENRTKKGPRRWHYFYTRDRSAPTSFQLLAFSR